MIKKFLDIAGSASNEKLEEKSHDPLDLHFRGIHAFLAVRIESLRLRLSGTRSFKA